MGDRPVKKDHRYYEDRIWADWRARMDALPQGLDDAAFAELFAELEEESAPERIARIGMHFNEARAIIETLFADPDPTEPTKTYEVVWADRVHGTIDRSDAPPTLRGTRAEILQRLHWITSETFGEDLDEWSDWLQAFEENTPLPFS